MLPIESCGSKPLNEVLAYLNKNLKITSACLSKVTGVEVELIEKLINGQADIIELGLPLENLTKLSNTSRMLAQGISEIDDNQRLKAIIEHLTENLEVDIETIAIYSGITIEEIKMFMDDPNSISYEKRYKLAVKSLFLHFFFK